MAASEHAEHAEHDFGEALRGFLGWPSAYPSASVDADAAGGKGADGSGGANGSANASVNVTGGGAGGAGGKAGANISVTNSGGKNGQSDADTSFHGVFASLGAMFPSSSSATNVNAGYGAGWQAGDGSSAASASGTGAADAPGRGRRPRSTYAPIDAAGGEDEASRAKRDALARQRGPAGAYWRSASDLDAGAQPSWWDWRGLSETEQSQWIATAIMIILSAAVGWFVLNGGMARFAAKASAMTFAPLARGARAGVGSAGTYAAGLLRLLLDAVAVAWSLLIAPFVGFGQSVSRYGVADRASSLLSAFSPRVYDVPAMPYGARPGPQGAAAAAGFGSGYGAAGVPRGAAFAPLLPSPGSMYAAPARGFSAGARPPVQLPGARNAQRFAPGARAPARLRTPEQEEQDRRAELFHSGRCGSNNPDVELCDSIKQRRWSAPRDRAGRPVNADVPVRPLGPQYAQTHTALAQQTAHAGFYAAQQGGFGGGTGGSQAPFAFGAPGQCPPKRAPPPQCGGPPPPPPPPRQCAGPPSCLAEAQAAALSEAEALAAESAAAAAAEAAEVGADGECAVWLAADDADEAAAQAQAAPPAPEGDAHLPVCGAEHDALPLCGAADLAAAAPAAAVAEAKAKEAAAPAAAAPKAASLRVKRSGGDLSAMQRSRAAAFAAAKCGSADADAAACKALLDTALEAIVPGAAADADAAPAADSAPAAPAARASLWKRLLAGAKSKPAAAAAPAAAPAPAPVVAEAAAAPAAEPAAVVKAVAPAVAEAPAPAAAPKPAGLSSVARRRVAVAQAAASCASARGASDAAAAALRASQTHLAGRLDAAAEAHAACRAMLPTNGKKPSRATAERHDACLRQSDALAADAETASDDFEAAARDAERLATVMVESCGAVAAAA